MSLRSGATKARRETQRGLSLVEIVITTGVLSVGLTYFVSSVTDLRTNRVEAERSQQATQALKQTIETLQFLGVNQAFEAYGPDGTGEPFVAPLLFDPTTNTPSEVNIQFFVDETAERPELGLPMDLDGDGTEWTTDVSERDPEGDLLAKILPVELTITWQALRDTRTLTWQSTIIRD